MIPTWDPCLLADPVVPVDLADLADPVVLVVPAVLVVLVVPVVLRACLQCRTWVLHMTR